VEARRVHGKVSRESARRGHRIARCFKCLQERDGKGPGWYFLDVPDRREPGEWFRVFVCPRDYLEFAASEQSRWTPLGEESPDVPVPDATRPPLPDRSLQELVAMLSQRGLTGWALLVRDVAEGRIRRVHLRRLPADPEIREALVSYLRSAGADITLGPGLRARPQDERDQRDGNRRNTSKD
jgi:hypothetical protein